jgi:hypothetical protein
MLKYRILADVTVVAHAAYVAFVVFGLVAILLGAARGWGWVRNFWFRAVHFLAIAVVAAEALLGIACPLTTLENDLRQQAGEAVESGSFIGRLAHDLLFYDAPQWIFSVLHVVFAVVVLVTLILVPPRWPWKGRR